jgi:ABC-type multidrug transport system ATPase subunit
MPASDPASHRSGVPYLDDAPLLEICGVSKAWRRTRRTVLADIDLVACPGSRVWIGGKNGVGKTTLMRVVTGVLAPDQGSISLHGLDSVKDRRRYQRFIAFLPAGNSGLYARLTVAQHLDLWARIGFVARGERPNRVAEIIEQFALEGLIDSRVDRLSMGQRQRVRLAMTFLPEPRMVLLDEPRNSLDDDGYVALEEAVRRTTERRGCVMWCSPAGEAVGMDYDQGLILEDGRLRAL